MTLHGVLAVWKPKGCTSHDVVNRIRRLAGQKRVGHTGTLDPEVEGVLPICLGQATRIAEYLQETPKRYRGSLRLGISTDTEDHTGQVLEQVPVQHVHRERIESVFRSFHGEIEQTPPMYSAVKVGGRRLYDLARSGQEVERPKRKVIIYELVLKEVIEGEYPEIRFEVLCSKGTYVRTLCVDLGKVLGYPAHMSSLVRTRSGPFSADDCFTLEELEEIARRSAWNEAVVPMDEALGMFPVFFVSDEDGEKVLNGWKLDVGQGSDSGRIVRVKDESDRLCALYRWLPDGTAKPEKVFRDVES
jgi:tRNA pseudouridine55 synthase